MIDSFASFFSEYEGFQRLITEYITSFQFGLTKMNETRQIENGRLLQELQIVEDQDNEKRLEVQHQYQQRISELILISIKSSPNPLT